MAFSKISEMTLRATGRSKSIVVFGTSGPPTNLTASNATIGTINLSWNAPSTVPGSPAITSYTVFISGATSAQINTGNTNTSYSWTGGTKGLSYTFYVVANNAGGSSSPSNTVSSEVLGNVATGGAVTDVANYNGTGQTWRVHTFTTVGTNTFTVTSANQPFRVLAVAGGGGGGVVNKGGGGGGGGMLANNTVTTTVASHTITVGGGGSGLNNGGNSSALGLTAIGGGAGANSFGNSPSSGSSGGSGGGGWGSGGAGTAGQGNAGGTGDAVYASGSGGGAGATGNGPRGYELSGVGGNGAASNITGNSVTYAGGGGGGHNTGINPPSPGGTGGGGQTASNGTNGLGGGGGGGGTTGGSGIVIISYQLS